MENIGLPAPARSTRPGTHPLRRLAMAGLAVALTCTALGALAPRAEAGTLTRLGGMDLGRYCAARYPYHTATAYGGSTTSYTMYVSYAAGAVLVSNDARGWRCEQWSTTVSSGPYIPRWSNTRYGINVDDVCRWQYRRGYAVLEANNARGWVCYAWSGPGY